MAASFFLVLALLFLANVAESTRILPSNHHNKEVSKALITKKLTKPTLCESCMDAGQDFIEFILEGGDMLSFEECVSLCNKVSGGTGCVAICQLIGASVIYDLLIKSKLDAVYFCELAKVCVPNDCPSTTPSCANITDVELKVDTENGQLIVTTTTKATATFGPVDVMVMIPDCDCPEGDPQHHYFEKLDATSATPVKVQHAFQVFHPGADYEDNWPPGTYDVIVQVCDGECTKTNPHSRLMAQVVRPFTIQP